MLNELWERRYLVFVLIVAAAVAYRVLTAPASDNRQQTIVVPENATLAEILAVDVFEPYDLDLLKYNAQGRYGEPIDTRRSSNRHARTYERDYVGEYGVITLWEFETALDGISRSVEFAPKSLRLEETIRDTYLSRIQPKDGEWYLRFESDDHSLYLDVELTGRKITRISLSY